jgi:transcriptional regulator with XRE-family HTH domain
MNALIEVDVRRSGGTMKAQESAVSSIPVTAHAETTDVGSRLREARRSQHRTLREVAAAAEVSESFLSQVERAKVSASVATLRRIAVALGVTIGDLFENRPMRQPAVLLAASRPTLTFGLLGRKFHLHTAPDRAFDSFLCEFNPGGSTGDEAYAHGDSEEFLLLLEGAAEFQLGDDLMTLEPDDSIVYRSSTPHRLVADPELGARVLWITSPPSY